MTDRTMLHGALALTVAACLALTTYAYAAVMEPEQTLGDGLKAEIDKETVREIHADGTVVKLYGQGVPHVFAASTAIYDLPATEEAETTAGEQAQESHQRPENAPESPIEDESDYEYQEWYIESTAASEGPDYGNPLKQAGGAEDGERTYAWYSQRVLPGDGLTELNENGRHVDEETGFVVDGDGYIAVASPWGQDEIGTVIDTPFGQAKVYDKNAGDAYDLYTDF